MKTMETADIQRQVLAATERGSEPTSASAHVPPISQGWITGLSLLIGLLALVATTAGIFTAFGAHHRTFTSLRGETITLQGGGLYAHESVSGAAQAIGQDVVTLLIAIPLLLAATYLAARGSLRGQLLRAGALWYFTYTYVLMAFGAAYNQLFLVYVVLYSASLFAFILSLLAIDVKRLPAQVSPRFARRTIAWLVIGFGGILALLWLGRIMPALTSGAAPAGLESYSTLFVQAGDLGLVVPLAILTGTLLLTRHPVGYLLVGVLLVKGTTLGLALIAMTIAMVAAGVAIAPVEAVFFTAGAVICGVGTVHLFRCLPSRRVETGQR
jgi:hypothetical protein